MAMAREPNIMQARLVTGEYLVADIEELDDEYIFHNAIAVFPKAQETSAGVMIAFRGGEPMWGHQYSCGNPFQTFTLWKGHVLLVYPVALEQVLAQYLRALTAATMQAPDPASQPTIIDSSKLQ